MARVIIIDSLKQEIYKKFKQESKKIFTLMLSLEENPKKGKVLGKVAEVIIKELKYKSFRFYFLVEGDLIKFSKKSTIEEDLIKFVRMSNKKYQQKTIDEIKYILLNSNSGNL